MSHFPFDTILFDLDGTLVDSNRDLAPAVNHALVYAGHGPIAESEIRNFIGGGAALMLRRALEAKGEQPSEERMAELTDVLLKHYWAHIADNTVPFDGVIATLDGLAAKGCKLAVCTNKLEKPARQLLDALGMTHHFTAIYGGDTCGPDCSKPQPDMLLAAIKDCGGTRAAMVGDSTYDVRAARNAEVPVVTLSFGYHDVPVSELGGDVMIEHFDHLIPALEKLA
ncbi:HAD-IA family hydrolase [Aurantiacibacter flavus]|uniref:Phosphoglycolate phosphatase n=1 Tax=Aurantiacibacter flavus TaxID=3145232 RepID=A0ABV0CVI5_9SPHN